MARPRFRAYPNAGTITIADGESYPIRVTGNFINVKQADQSFTIRLDGTEELRAAQNRRFKLTEVDAFSLVEVINDSGSSLTFQIEVGFGSVESDDVTITGTVSTSDSTAHTKLDTLEATLTSIETDIAALETLLNSDENQRKGLTTFDNASYATVSGATTTIVTSGANTSGAIIRFCNINQVGNYTSHLSIGGNKIFETQPAAGVINNHIIRDLFVPAGESIVIYSENAANPCYIAYEVL